MSSRKLTLNRIVENPVISSIKLNQSGTDHLPDHVVNEQHHKLAPVIRHEQIALPAHGNNSTAQRWVVAQLLAYIRNFGID